MGSMLGRVQVGAYSMEGLGAAAARRRMRKLEPRWRSSTCRGMQTRRFKCWVFAMPFLDAMQTAAGPRLQGAGSSVFHRRLLGWIKLI